MFGSLVCFANCVMKATSAKASTERRYKETWMDHRVVVFARVKMKRVGLMFRKTMRNLSTMHTSSPEQGATLHGLRFFYPLVCVSTVFSAVFPAKDQHFLEHLLENVGLGTADPSNKHCQNMTMLAQETCPSHTSFLYAKNPKVFFSKDPKQDWQDALRKRELLG